MKSKRIPGSWNVKNLREVGKVKVKSLSRVRLFVTPWIVAYEVPLSPKFSRQEYWSGLPFPPLEDLPVPGIEPGSPALQADAFTIWATRETYRAIFGASVITGNIERIFSVELRVGSRSKVLSEERPMKERRNFFYDWNHDALLKWPKLLGLTKHPSLPRAVLF